MNFIDDALAENLRVLRPYILKNNIEAYRILNFPSRPSLSEAKQLMSRPSEASVGTTIGIPVAVDIYKDNAVIHVFGALNEDVQKNLEESLKRMVGAQWFFYKNRTNRPSRSSAKQLMPRHGGATLPKEIIINEYGNKFLINLSDYLDTGIFLDHRETRKWIATQSRGKTVLNTFAYTGSFSVYAAKGGAKLTHSVDLSKTYCEWMKENLELNKMDLKQNWILKMDTREYFKYARKKHLAFDIIIIDPPTFSRNKGSNFSVQRDHPALINEALQILSPAGFILFSNNYTEFSLQENKLKPCAVKEKHDTLPPDFLGSQAHRCFIIA